MARPSLKFNCKGISLAHPADNMPAGFFPILKNVRVVEQGRLESRQGIATRFDISGSGGVNGPVHSIRRVENSIDSTTIHLTGIADKLYLDNAKADEGYSGNPLAILPFRPSKSPNPIAYVGDSSRLRKLSMAGEVFEVGIRPPALPPTVAAEVPNFVMIADFEAGGWTNSGTAGAPSVTARYNTTVSHAIFDQADYGWCSVVPAADQGFQAGAKIILKGSETSKIREVLKPINATVISSILYDVGSTGMCSITLYDNSPSLVANAVVDIDGEYVRVQEVVLGADGLPSIRCSTINPHIVGQAVTGHLSLRLYSGGNLVGGNTLTSNKFAVAVATGTGQIKYTAARNLQVITPTGEGGRPTTLSDYIHISLSASPLTDLTSITLLIDISDATFTKDYYSYTVTPDKLSGEGWNEIIVRISDFTRVGSDGGKSLATVSAIGVDFVAANAITVQLAGWWIAGTYGVDWAAGESGILYGYRYRDSRTGARSNMSPATRTPLYPQREQYLISVAESADPQVDTIDICRFGGGVNTWMVVESYPNITSTVIDSLTPAAAAVAETVDFDNYQPFPISDLPKSGRVRVSGTSVLLLTGDRFNVDWVPGSTIIVGGRICTLYGSPSTEFRLTLVESAGYSDDTEYSIPEATIAARPLPVIWMFSGQGLGTFMFGVGDPFNPGFVRWCKGNDPDAASDTGNLELTAPSEPLMSGCVYDSRIFVFSTDRLFALLPNFTGQGNQFTAQDVQTGVGLYARWGMTVTPYGIAWVGKDGVYIWSGGKPENLTNPTLYPLFPHAGEDIGAVNGFNPPDYTQPNRLRLSFAQNSLYFTYLDTTGVMGCLRFDFAVGGWFPESYSPSATIFYSDEGDQTKQVLMGAANGTVQRINGVGMDNAAEVECRVRSPFIDLGDSRSQKYFQDVMVDYRVPALNPVFYYDNLAASFTAAQISANARSQSIIPLAIDNGDQLELHRNIAIDLTWNGAGEVYEFQPNAIAQPLLVKGLTTQYTDHGIPGFSHEKEAWVSLISTADSVLHIWIDGTEHQYLIPSTASRFNRVRLSLGPLKGTRWMYQITSSQSFIPFPDQIQVLVKQWGSDAPFTVFYPFREVGA